MPTDDDTLIGRVQKNDDRQAFTELVKRYQSRLRYSLRQLTGHDAALADDLAQETFIRAYRHLGGFRGDARFFTWLYRIAWRCFADHHRQRKREADIDPGQLPEAGYTTHERDDLHIDFARALLHFEPAQRMTLHLHLQRGFTHSEIAHIMACPLGTVKSHIQRGKPKLQQLMEAWQT